MLSKVSLTLAGLLFIGQMSIADAATVRFDYSGNEFTDHGAGFFPSDDRISGHIVVDLALIGGTINSQTFGAFAIPEWQFTDGDSTFNQSNAGTFNVAIATDASGNIINWALGLGEGSFTFKMDSNGLADGGYPIGDRSFIACENPGCRIASTSQPGTWTTNSPAPVPLPAAFPLLAVGLGLLGLFGWRKKWIAAA